MTVQDLQQRVDQYVPARGERRMPVIGISANRKEGLSCIAETYVRAVLDAGGAPVLIPVYLQGKRSVSRRFAFFIVRKSLPCLQHCRTGSMINLSPAAGKTQRAPVGSRILWRNPFGESYSDNTGIPLVIRGERTNRLPEDTFHGHRHGETQAKIF